MINKSIFAVATAALTIGFAAAAEAADIFTLESNGDASGLSFSTT